MTGLTDNLNPGRNRTYEYDALGRLRRATGSAGSSSSGSGTLSAPATLNATATASQVSLSWASVSGAAQYRVERRAAATGAYEVVATTAHTSWTDSGVSGDKSYLYRVRAVSGSGQASAASPAQLATTVAFTDEPLASGVTIVRAAHFEELRRAVLPLAHLTLVAATQTVVKHLVKRARATGSRLREEEERSDTS